MYFFLTVDKRSCTAKSTCKIVDKIENTKTWYIFNIINGDNINLSLQIEKKTGSRLQISYEFYDDE